MTPHDWVRQLLRKARQDEAVLERLLPEFDIADEIVGFHAQQAVEKLLKAWLAHVGVDFPKVHSLEMLAELLQAHGAAMPQECAELSTLTPFATAYRYDELPSDTVFDRPAALRLVQTLRRHVENVIASD